MALLGSFTMWPGTQGEVLFRRGDFHHLLPCLLPRWMEKSHLETAHRPLVARVFLTHSHLPGGPPPFSEFLPEVYPIFLCSSPLPNMLIFWKHPSSSEGEGRGGMGAHMRKRIKQALGDAESEAGQGAWDGAELCVSFQKLRGPLGERRKRK